MKIILATANEHKKVELEEILTEHQLVLASEAGFDMDYDETGDTYFANAYGKALHVFQQGGTPVIADDSGLSVPALGGAPGIYSARYGSESTGKKLSAEERNALLLKNMQGVTDREGFFVCAVIFLTSPYIYQAAQDTLEGIIAEAPSGSKGFGYDPVFFLPEYGKTVAEIDSELKSKISHRGKAVSQLAGFLNNHDNRSTK